MHCLAAYYSELAPSTCTFANQLHCAVALLHLPNVLLSGLGGALLEAAHCTALAREQSVGVVWMQKAAMPARNSVWIISHCRPRQSSSIAMQHNAMLPTHKAGAAPRLHKCTCCCFFDTGTNCSMRQTQRAKQLAGFAWDSCSSRLTNEHLPRLLLTSTTFNHTRACFLS